MAGKKGVIPSHVKKKHFDHPGIENPLVNLLERVEDSRKPSAFLRYSLTSVLFMTLVGIMCGANDWPKVVIIAQSLSSWLSGYVDMTAGVPCERTFKNLINALSPHALEKVLRELAGAMRKPTHGEVISFDGQTCRGTADAYLGLGGIHLLSAWSSDNGICIGQIKVDDKSNEITAIPELMDMLDLKGAVITTDALNTRKGVASRAVAQGGDYLLPVKGNQPYLHEAVINAFEAAEKEQAQAKALWERSLEKAREQRDESRIQKLLTKGVSNSGLFLDISEPEKSHGRIEMRTCLTLSSKDLPIATDWEGIKSIVRIDRKRIVGDKQTHERVHYISSLAAENPTLIANIAREHWGVENGLHWRLDVVFRQDKSRYRDRNGARNLAAMRKIALNALSRDTSMKGGVATKQFAAALNSIYRDKLLKNLF